MYYEDQNCLPEKHRIAKSSEGLLKASVYEFLVGKICSVVWLSPAVLDLWLQHGKVTGWVHSEPQKGLGNKKGQRNKNVQDTSKRVTAIINL